MEFFIMEVKTMQSGRRNPRMPALLLVTLLLLLSAQFAGLFGSSTARAAIANPQITVTLQSTGTGTQTFDVNGNSPSTTNQVMVVPGTQDFWSVAFNDANVNNVRVIETDTKLATDYAPGAAPIQWGLPPREAHYTIGFFPQINGVETGENVFIDVYSWATRLSATPNIVSANGADVSIMPDRIPAATKFYVFNKGIGGADEAPTTNAGFTTKYSRLGVAKPTVKLYTASMQLITDAVANNVFVNMPSASISPANSTQEQGSTVVFRIPELAGLMNVTTPLTTTDVVWTLPDGSSYNTRLAVTNGDQARADELSLNITKSGVLGVSIQADGIEVGSAATSITMHVTPPPAAIPPSYVAQADPVWTASQTGTLSIFVSNPTSNPANMAIRVLAPGYQEYNAWLGSPHTTLPDGRVKVDVPLNFPTAGVKSISIAMDYADANSVWQHLTPTSVSVNVQPQPSGEIQGKKLFHTSEAMSFKLVLHNLQLQPGDNVLWTGPWGEFNTGSQSDPTTFAKFQVTPWQGNVVVRVQRGNSNLLTVYLNDVVAGQKWGIYLPNVVVPPKQVTITASTAAPKKGVEMQFTAQYATGTDVHFTWNFADGRGDYDSTVGHGKGEQPADNIVRFTPGERRHYVVTLTVTAPDATGVWGTRGIGTYEFDAR